MKREELLAMINEYLAGMVNSIVFEDFEQPMSGCSPQQVVRDNIFRILTHHMEGRTCERPVRFRGPLQQAQHGIAVKNSPTSRFVT